MNSRRTSHEGFRTWQILQDEAGTATLSVVVGGQTTVDLATEPITVGLRRGRHQVARIQFHADDAAAVVALVSVRAPAIR